MSEQNFEGERVSSHDESLILGSRVGSGAEGAVYHVDGADSVVKIFEEGKREEKARKVRAMVSRSPRDPTYEHREVRSIVWPTAVVKEPQSGSFLGYQMPYKNLDEHKNVRKYARDELQWEESFERERYITALNLTRVVDAIHKQGHAIGDLNHQNVLVKDGYVSLIDCDAFHISAGMQTYSGSTFFPRYAPPEGRGETLEDVRYGDRFGLAVHLFQLLMEGFHPFQASGSEVVSGGYADMIREHSFPYDSSDDADVRPHSLAPTYERLPVAIRRRFADCFGEGKEDPDIRPSPDDWKATFNDLLESREADTDSTGRTSPTDTVDASETNQSSIDLGEPDVEKPTQASSDLCSSEGDSTLDSSTLRKNPRSPDNASTDRQRQSVDVFGDMATKMKRVLYYLLGLFLVFLLGYILIVVT